MEMIRQIMTGPAYKRAKAPVYPRSAMKSDARFNPSTTHHMVQPSYSTTPDFPRDSSVKKCEGFDPLKESCLSRVPLVHVDPNTLHRTGPLETKSMIPKTLNTGNGKQQEATLSTPRGNSGLRSHQKISFLLKCSSTEVRYRHHCANLRYVLVLLYSAIV